MSQIDVRPSPQTSTDTGLLADARIPVAAKTCAVGAGVMSSVYCGTGVVAAVAAAVGAGGVLAFTKSWVQMQGLTLVSAAFAIAVVLGLAAWVTRRARASVPAGARLRIYQRSLVRLAAWALGGYAVYFVLVNMILGLLGFKYSTS